MKQLAAIAFLFLSVQLSAQCLLREIPLQQRINQSKVIVEGRVTETTSFWNEDHTMIYTRNTVEVLKIFKGQLSASNIEVLTEGGRVGLEIIRAEPSLSLQAGETGIFMCEPVQRFRALPTARTTTPRFEAYGSLQGFIRYDLQLQTAADPFKNYTNVEEELYRTISPAANYKTVKPFSFPKSSPSVLRTTAVSGFSPSIITAGTGALLTINGSGFGATRGSGYVAFRNGDDGGASYIAPLPTQYISWTDGQIVVEVPDGAGSGTFVVMQGSTFTSPSSLTISYAHNNLNYDLGAGNKAFPTRHIDDNGAGGYTWQMNTAFDANAAAKASFMRAFNTWRCNTGINWTIGATTSVNVAVADGTNVIAFDNVSPLSAGLLGTCYSRYTGCSPDGINMEWWVTELDIIFDEGSNITPRTWEYGTGTPSSSEYDFETVAVHELGHGMQLVHVISPGAIMHYAITNGTYNRLLSASDLAGGNFVQSKGLSVSDCDEPAMTAYASCSVLPITVSSINAYKKEKGIQVDWINLAESEVNYYEVEKSGNGNNFISAVRVSSKGNKGNRESYEWLDQTINNGSNFYRIKSVGYGGDVKYTKVVRVDLNDVKPGFNVYPNPVQNSRITVELSNLEKGLYTFALYNAAGQQVAGKVIVHNGGSSIETWDLQKMPAGIYQLEVRGKSFTGQQAILIKK